MNSPESSPELPTSEQGEAKRLNLKRDIEGDGFVLKKNDSRLDWSTRNRNLPRLEFRPGETSGKAWIRENIQKAKQERDQIRKYLRPGNLVQWIDFPFEKPKIVTKITDDREFVFVEGSETGIPIDQISVEYLE
ncbi:MAG: hypothetical protein COV95_00910 [Candidatus Zambryskibacteria bacterium CG11_big_fil_rev_8_21_14_0_20_40_24]|uniref:Uncharacterized protein n=1 Tax=Candidatus Zambryskibacteria bacterium CG11_big_fil_rev_8_21_14_0_20_40_24 TaxID=1975116 RepID=A0A2H0K702_9BACT|nr:MAG: hypothetical protein COV95_00910 [Candidatus Zambryskibacteria bacterium CG11_big_fil_rev_8_21_14_0_20_40_24]